MSSTFKDQEYADYRNHSDARVPVEVERCESCGKPERFNVLCSECEDLCCPNACTGRPNECDCCVHEWTDNGPAKIRCRVCLIVQEREVT